MGSTSVGTGLRSALKKPFTFQHPLSGRTVWRMTLYCLRWKHLGVAFQMENVQFASLTNLCQMEVFPNGSRCYIGKKGSCEIYTRWYVLRHQNVLCIYRASNELIFCAASVMTRAIPSFMKIENYVSGFVISYAAPSIFRTFGNRFVTQYAK